MAVIENRSAEHWSTTGDVLEYVDIKVRSGDPDVETDIDSATSSVQSWLIKDTSHGPGDWPDPATLSEDGSNDLLGKAVTLLAASEYHERKSRNVQSSSTNQGRDTPRHVFFESRAESKYEDWLVRHNYEEDPETGGSQIRGLSRSSGGRSGSLIDQPTRAEREQYQRRHGWY